VLGSAGVDGEQVPVQLSAELGLCHHLWERPSPTTQACLAVQSSAFPAVLLLGVS